MLAALLIPILLSAQAPAPEERARMGDAVYTHSGGLNALARSPDGRLFVSAGAGRSIRIWDLAEGRLQTRFEPPDAPAEFLAVSVDGTRFATGHPDHPIRVWSLPGGNLLATLTDAGRIVTGIAFTASENLLISTRSDGSVALWDTSTASIVRTWTVHRRAITALTASADGTRFASAGDKEGVALWTLDGGQKIDRPAGLPTEIRSLVFSPDGKRLAVGSETGRAAVWDLSAARVAGMELVAPQRDAVTALVCSPDGTRLACGSARGDLVVWDTAAASMHPLADIPIAGIRGLVWSADGSTLISGDAAGRIVFRDAAQGKVRRESAGHGARIRTLAYSPAGDVLASGGDDRSVRLWDAATGKLIRVLDGAGWPVSTLTYSPDGRRLLGAGQESSARIWEVATGKIDESVHAGRRSLTAAAWSPSGAAFAVGASDGGIHLLEAGGPEVAVPLLGHTHAVTGLSYSPWAQTLASASYDSTIRIWDLATKKETARFTVPDSMPYSIAASPDGLLLAVASVGRHEKHLWNPDHLITLWDLSTGQKLGQHARFESLGPAQGRLEFASDGRRLFEVRDGSLRAWSLPGGQEIPLPLKTGPVTAFRLSPDGRSVALALENLTIVVLDLETLAPRPKPSPDLDAAALGRHWDELARPEADRAFKSVCALADSPGSAVAFLKTRIVPVTFEEIERLIAKLDDDDATVRDRAARLIRATGTPELLEKFLERKPPLETALRIRALMAEQKEMKAGATELDRALRAISVLEMTGTADAKALLETLASGAESARQTQAAKAALRRLSMRRTP